MNVTRLAPQSAVRAKALPKPRFGADLQGLSTLGNCVLQKTELVYNDAVYASRPDPRGIPGTIEDNLMTHIRSEANNGQHIMMLGDGGCGKSTLLGRLERLLQRENIPVYTINGPTGLEGVEDFVNQHPTGRIVVLAQEVGIGCIAGNPMPLLRRLANETNNRLMIISETVPDLLDTVQMMNEEAYNDLNEVFPSANRITLQPLNNRDAVQAISRTASGLGFQGMTEEVQSRILANLTNNVPSHAARAFCQSLASAMTVVRANLPKAQALQVESNDPNVHEEIPEEVLRTVVREVFDVTI